jgi:hypothetical protein
MSHARLSSRLARLEAHVAERRAPVPTKSVADEIEEIRRDLLRTFREQGPVGVYKYLEGRGLDHPESWMSMPATAHCR